MRQKSHYALLYEDPVWRIEDLSCSSIWVRAREHQHQDLLLQQELRMPGTLPFYKTACAGMETAVSLQCNTSHVLLPAGADNHPDVLCPVHRHQRCSRL